jgi:Ca2+:H+ antiporter
MSIIALEQLFEWGGEQLAMNCGPDLGDLIIITLNKYILLLSSSLDKAVPD